MRSTCIINLIMLYHIMLRLLISGQATVSTRFPTDAAQLRSSGQQAAVKPAARQQAHSQVKLDLNDKWNAGFCQAACDSPACMTVQKSCNRACASLFTKMSSHA